MVKNMSAIDPLLRALIEPKTTPNIEDNIKAVIDNSNVAGKRSKTMSLIGTPLARL